MHSLLYILFSVSLLFLTATTLLASDDRKGTAPGQLTDPFQSGWAATYGGVDSDLAASIRQTRDGGYIVTGSTRSFGTGSADIWILKLRPDGSVEWQKTYGGDRDDEGNSIQQTRDGGYIVVGRTSSFGAGEDDICAFKLESDGAVEWQKTYGGDRSDEARFVQQTKDGGYIVAGWTDSFGAGPGDRDAWVLKLTQDGAVDWQKTYGGIGDDSIFSIHETRKGGYIVACGTESFGAGQYDFWVLKLRVDGSVEWQKTYGESGWELAHSIRETSDGGYIVAGETSSFGVLPEKFLKRIIFDFWILKLNPNGSIHPSCDFIRETNLSGEDSNAAVKSSRIIAFDSRANPQSSTLQSQATNVLANILCPQAASGED